VIIKAMVEHEAVFDLFYIQKYLLTEAFSPTKFKNITNKIYIKKITHN